MKKITIILFLAISTFINLNAQSNQYKAQVKEYMRVTGSLNEFTSTIKEFIDIFKNNEAYASIPEKFWSDFEKEINQMSDDDLVELFAPVYYKYYSEEDLKQIIAFYNSPVGLKMQKSNEKLTEDSKKVGERWGRELGERLVQKLQKEMK